jgi:hypothetical protein
MIIFGLLKCFADSTDRAPVSHLFPMDATLSTARSSDQMLTDFPSIVAEFHQAQSTF